MSEFGDIESELDHVEVVRVQAVARRLSETVMVICLDGGSHQVEEAF